MKAIVILESPVSIPAQQLIFETFNASMDIKPISLDAQTGEFYFTYNSPIALVLASKLLASIGHPIISYRHPPQRPGDLHSDPERYT